MILGLGTYLTNSSPIYTYIQLYLVYNALTVLGFYAEMSFHQRGMLDINKLCYRTVCFRPGRFALFIGFKVSTE